MLLVLEVMLEYMFSLMETLDQVIRFTIFLEVGQVMQEQEHYQAKPLYSQHL
jgi:hypothetical protein